MNSSVKKEVVEVLKASYNAVREDDVKAIRDESNNLIQSASLYQDESVIAVSVILYGLSKIYERSDYRGYPEWEEFHENVLLCLKQAYLHLINNEDAKYNSALGKLLSSIDKLGSKLKKYIKDVMDKAHISKASRFYEHGVSVGRTAKLLGVSSWDLMDYVGGTGIADVEENITQNVFKRIKFTRGLFK